MTTIFKRVTNELWDISKKIFETHSNNLKKIIFFLIVILIFTPK